jgi:hypothetical protein
MRGLLPVSVQRDVAYTQAKGCCLCLHVWTWAIYFGRRASGRGPRLELLTPLHRFRWSRGYKI